MIRFTLRCDRDHRFESWFRSATAFDTLRDAGRLSCPACGSPAVEKALMAPRVTGPRDTAEAPAPATPDGAPRAARPEPAGQALAALRHWVAAHSDDVGRDFARQARAMHDGVTTERPIHGEARPDEARALVEDGLPIIPLPFPARGSTN